MRDAEVEGAPHDRAARLEGVVVPEVVPEAERDRGKLEAAAARAVVDHPLVAVRGGDEGHEALPWLVGVGNSRAPAPAAER